MKKNGILKICMTVCLVLGMVLAPACRIKSQAATIIATVEGTVLKKTTSEILFLSTKEGEMQIKLDKDTDTSECKVLLPDRRIGVSLSHGSDGYLHAVKISNKTTTAEVTVDSLASATVTGTISEKTNGDILFVKTPQGDMEIKLDATTDMSGCTVLVANQTYTIVCARGSDAYMHALSISGGALAGTSGSWLTPAPADPDHACAPTMSVAGTVKKNTTESILYLSTNDGDMQFFIESNTDARQGMVLVPGNQVAVAYYRSSDSSLYATCIVGVKTSIQTATIQSATATVSGTVGNKSNEEILYLDTPQGEMQLKLDGLKKAGGFKVLTSGRKLTVVCAGGSDAYMHAIEISAD